MMPMSSRPTSRRCPATPGTGSAPAPDPTPSLLPDADTVLCREQFVAPPPPVTVGALGAVRSIRAVFVAPFTLGVHADTLPALSTDRNCTSVCPSFTTVKLLPATAADQVEPPFVDTWYW